jgi:hypothetical protein
MTWCELACETVLALLCEMLMMRLYHWGFGMKLASEKNSLRKWLGTSMEEFLTWKARVIWKTREKKLK